jgi:hypothetical protein
VILITLSAVSNNKDTDNYSIMKNVIKCRERNKYKEETAATLFLILLSYK